MNLRFPGQYWDEETQTHYNFKRDYIPGVGRYVQSDPIGVKGGMNTLLYAKANTLKNSDPLGLFSISGDCTVLQVAELELAARRVRELLEKECKGIDCRKSACMPNEWCDRMLEVFNRVKVNCTQTDNIKIGGLIDISAACAFAPVGGDSVTFKPKGFRYKPGEDDKCGGCPARSLYHELFHNAGLDHGPQIPSLLYGGILFDEVSEYESRCANKLCM
ncbi:MULTISPECIES: RHS repeat-associated core domain-containing protein [unclassified Acidovorax]|uniref:RHS repeat-associated core domain-containing protein n=2 Tax=Acidovorax TaxID=12916 RepID=UPI001F3605C3|nr:MULTISPECIES: RHS repeat-associated core domain-containing protein [unclassified Acidovorax]